MLSGFAPLTRGRQVATTLGLVYTILGIVGFAVSGFDGFAATRGDTLTIFEVNPLQNLIHLALGWWLVRAGFAGESPGRRASWVAVFVLAVLGLAGVLVFGNRPELNVINTNQTVDIAHLLSAALGAVFLVLPSRAERVTKP